MINNIDDMKYATVHYELLADVYAYPQEDYAQKVWSACKLLDDYLPEAAGLLRVFADYMCSLPTQAQQELFVRSFEVQAVTTLDLGYVLFGDDYKRGELLVNLNREHREAGVNCGSELADHLANVLRLLPRIQDEELQEELARRIIAAALRRMIKGFHPEQIELKDRFYKKNYKTILDRPENYYTIYSQALAALYVLLQHDFGFEERESPEQTSDFLHNLNSEVKLEHD
jgi:nitrate reductase assembly molybdenum cofactor insertion protein NarJ